MSKHTEQIAKMAEEHIKDGGTINKPITWGYESFIKGGTAVMESLDIDENKFMDIAIQYSLGRISTEEAKQQILQSITIKEKP